LDRRRAIEEAQVNRGPRLQAAWLGPRLCQGEAESHREAGGVRGREELLGTGAGSVRNAGQDAVETRPGRVAARPDTVAYRYLPRSVHQTALPRRATDLPGHVVPFSRVHPRVPSRDHARRPGRAPEVDVKI